jgi:tRNA (guanine37-N1)-methyltransferase
MRFDIITIFPEMFGSLYAGGVVKKALDRGLLEVIAHDLRDYTSDKHKQVDDRPFGGGQGMVLKPEPIFKAVEAVRKDADTPVFLLSPQGRRFNTRVAERMAKFSQVILICGRYEGVDERVTEFCATEEISIGDYVLTGGEPAALVVLDAVSRFVPGVVGRAESVEQDSFQEGLFDCPQYTRPRTYRGMKTPDVLFSGDHNKIDEWREKRALEKTWRNRPDLLDFDKLPPAKKKWLEKIISARKGKTDEPD